MNVNTDVLPKLSVPQQIEHMKAQGIRFSVMTEEDAAKYLEINTYYFKIKVYAKLYEKYTDKADPGRYGKYIDLYKFFYMRNGTSLFPTNKLLTRIAVCWISPD